jgi:transcriptional regulator with XRE-family HTH domain
MLELRKTQGARLRAARVAAKVTLEEAGLEVGRSKQAVAAWEKGESDITATQVTVLCARYGISTDRVLVGMPPCDRWLAVGVRAELQQLLPPKLPDCCSAMTAVLGRIVRPSKGRVV